jgi:hypothetical protein
MHRLRGHSVRTFSKLCIILWCCQSRAELCVVLLPLLLVVMQRGPCCCLPLGQRQGLLLKVEADRLQRLRVGLQQHQPCVSNPGHTRKQTACCMPVPGAQRKGYQH